MKLCFQENEGGRSNQYVRTWLKIGSTFKSIFLKTSSNRKNLFYTCDLFTQED